MDYCISLCKKACYTLAYNMCIGTLFACYTQCMCITSCITSQYTCYTLVYNKPFYMVCEQGLFSPSTQQWLQLPPTLFTTIRLVGVMTTHSPQAPNANYIHTHNPYLPMPVFSPADVRVQKCNSKASLPNNPSLENNINLVSIFTSCKQTRI